MLYTNPNIGNLPTLRETVDILERLVEGFPVIHRGPFDPINDDEDSFLLTRTDTRYSLKPNITRQGALFGWLNNFDTADNNPIRASLFQGRGTPNYLLENVIKEDAEIIFESHPLYRLLQGGINIPHLRRPLRIYNPYGVAHSYGFPSHFISLTSSIDIAAFHACHRYDPITNEFTAITNTDSSGLIFIFELYAPFAMTPNLSTIGKQAFQRPGQNRLFAYHTNPDTVFISLPFVKGFQFRHTQESTDQFAELFHNGLDLYPNELLSNKLALLRSRQRYSPEAFRRNLANNPHDIPDRNRHRLELDGLIMDRSLNYEFTRNELQQIWFDRVNERWVDFWEDVLTPMLTDKQREWLLDLPNNTAYKIFFNPNDWFNRK